MMIPRHSAFLTCALAFGFFGATAAGQPFFTRQTGPQVVSGAGFTSEIVLLNTSSTTCEFAVVAHRMAGEVDGGVALGGQPGGVTTGFVGPHGSRNISVESTEGDYIGAVSTDLFTPECFNAFTMQIQYRQRDQLGRLSELFSYSAPRPLKPGQCALAAIEPDLDASDGNVVIPGFAAASLPVLQNARLCHTLKNDQGEPVTQEVCQTTDGSHQARLVTDIFGEGFESGDVSTWQVCLEASPSTGGSPPRIDPLFIDVVTEGTSTQFDANEHQVKRPGCLEDQFNACLDDRFQVSAEFRASPSTPMERARVGAVLPDQSGYFFFDDPSTFRLVVRAIDGCPVNDRFWVFYGATTNVEYQLRVVDTQVGQTKVYTSPAGSPFQPVTDTAAFATCP